MRDAARALILPLLVSVLSLTAQPALASPQTWNERQAVELFLARSPQVRAARQLVRTAEAEVVAAGVWQNPLLDVGREQVFSSGGPAEQNRLGVQLPWTVAGKRELRQAIARSSVRAAEAQAQHRVFSMTQDVRAAFSQAFAQEERAQVLEAHLATLRRLTRTADSRRKAGESAGYDAMRLRLAETGLQAQLVQARAEASEARARLAALLGQSLEGQLRQERPGPVPEAAALTRQALAQRADLAALKAEREQARQKLALAGQLRWPDPAVALGVKQTNEPTVHGLGYTAGLTWPLPVLDQGQAEQARAEAELAQLDAQWEAATTRLQAELPPVRSALVERLKFAERFEREMLARLPEVLRVAELAYQEGDQGVEALLNAHQAALEVRLQRLALLVASQAAQLELERLVGARLADR